MKKKDKRIMRRSALRTALKMSIGIIASVLIAQLIGLEFAASTCIVTLLGIQSTKRDTLRTAGQRIISIAYTIGIAIGVAIFIGSGILDFCIAVLILALITFLLEWTATLSINVVVLVHMFLQQVPFTGELILNEVIRVMVGLLIALAINWRMPTKENEFKQDMSDIEHSIENMLNTFAEILRGNDRTLQESGTHLKDLEQALDNGMENAYTFANNNLSSHAQYYMKYISMRKTDALILYKLYLYMQKLDGPTVLSGQLADLMDCVGHAAAIEHPMDEACEKAALLSRSLSKAPIPSTKNELSDITIIHLMKECLEEMLEAKQQFIKALSDEEYKRYLTSEHH